MNDEQLIEVIAAHAYTNKTVVCVWAEASDYAKDAYRNEARLHIEGLRTAGYAVVPMKPTAELLACMAARHRHDFGLLDDSMQKIIKTNMRQIHEEVVGKGFYRRAAAAVPQQSEGE